MSKYNELFCLFNMINLGLNVIYYLREEFYNDTHFVEAHSVEIKP